MKHALALRIAQSLVRRFEPYCERIEIAGSIRRLKPEVKDIELVLIPRWEKRETVGTLFPETLECNLLHEAFERGVYNQEGTFRLLRWIKPGIGHVEDWRIYPDGRYWRGFTEFDAGVKVDVFLTTPERWGTTLAIRTGAGEFSKALAGHALKVRHPSARTSYARAGERRG